MNEQQIIEDMWQAFEANIGGIDGTTGLAMQAALAVAKVAIRDDVVAKIAENFERTIYMSVPLTPDIAASIVKTTYQKPLTADELKNL
jgi:predicted metal-dependent hydrolase